MGRRRQTRRDELLPEYVTRVPSKNRVIWREYQGKGKFGKVVTLQGKKGPLPADAPVQDIEAAYRAQVVKTPGRTLEWLLRAFMKAPKLKPLEPRTLKHYEYYVEAISAKPLKNGGRFGDVALRKLSRAVIAGYRDKMADTPIQANRHLQFLSAVFTWAVEQEHITDNYAKGVRRFEQKARSRYIEDWEFELVQKLAPDYVAIAMELAYLMRARRAEVLAIRREDLLPDGILLRRAKGSQAEVTQWSDRLRAAVRAAESLHPATISPWLLHNKDGSQIKAEAFGSAWGRLMAKAKLAERFTFHDIKAKGVTDDEEGWAGHKSERMREIYERKARLKKATR